MGTMTRELFDTVSEFADENRGLRKRIKELEAALADLGHWEPVEDGIVFHETDSIPAEWNYPAHVESIAFLEVRGNGHRIACGSMPQEDEHEVYLPFKVRLCRWVEVDEAPEL